MKESRFYKKYEKWVKDDFPKAYIYRTSDKFRLGIPDFVMCAHGVFIAIEIKDEGGKLRPAQVEELIDITNAKGLSFTGIGYKATFVETGEVFDIREDTFKEVFGKCLSTQK